MLLHAEASTLLRGQRAKIRRKLQTDPRALHRVVLNPPECLHRVPVVDVLRWCCASRSNQSIVRIGAMAARDRINLLVELGNASERTRTWVTEHARVGPRGRGRGLFAVESVRGRAT